ncbi:Ingression protein fic1 [Neolecta irregularis DAH-3]|uniref:Ingression protein fic1 n=1 Tax=Neolecta irregularis (strain DAH-3) TaxID=1198029 RepID=A0A1U7LSN4_NEOID|nr:Ingression protein fic1 [Neolecta irregularis DAH-3]|eukprot:OLL25593.1 Ingression protein fic1 [Neolecta irregularis DAH-3]
MLALKKLGTLIIVVMKGKNLPNRQKIGKQDPYCILRIAAEAKRTPTDKRGGQSPKWDHELRFEIMDTQDHKSVKISVFNEDSKEPDLIGHTVIDLSSILKKGESDEWFQLKCKDRYAGEIYLEMTFYSAAKPPMPAKEAVHKQIKPKHRPLPNCPEGAIVPPVPLGPRDAGYIPHPPRRASNGMYQNSGQRTSSQPIRLSASFDARQFQHVERRQSGDLNINYIDDFDSAYPPRHPETTFPYEVYDYPAEQYIPEPIYENEQAHDFTEYPWSPEHEDPPEHYQQPFSMVRSNPDLPVSYSAPSLSPHRRNTQSRSHESLSLHPSPTQSLSMKSLTQNLPPIPSKYPPLRRPTKRNSLPFSPASYDLPEETTIRRTIMRSSKDSLPHAPEPLQRPLPLPPKIPEGYTDAEWYAVQGND